MNNGKRKKQYDDDFKRHIVELYEAGQSKASLAKEYSLAPTTVNNWIGFYQNSGSFKAKDNLSEEEKKIRELEAQLRYKQMEIDILKKAMVIMSKE